MIFLKHQLLTVWQNVFVSVFIKPSLLPRPCLSLGMSLDWTGPTDWSCLDCLVSQAHSYDISQPREERIWRISMEYCEKRTRGLSMQNSQYATCNLSERSVSKGGRVFPKDFQYVRRAVLFYSLPKISRFFGLTDRLIIVQFWYASEKYQSDLHEVRYINGKQPQNTQKLWTYSDLRYKADT